MLPMTHRMLCRVPNPPDAVPRCCFTQKSISRGEQLAHEMRILPELGRVASFYDLDLDQIPALVGEAHSKLTEDLLLFWLAVAMIWAWGGVSWNLAALQNIMNCSAQVKVKSISGSPSSWPMRSEISLLVTVNVDGYH